MMALSAKGQWLVEAGVGSLTLADQNLWRQWSERSGWTPGKEQTDELPPAVAEVALRALDALLKTLRSQLDDGLGPEEDETEVTNDLFSAEAVSVGLARSLGQHIQPPH